MQFEKCVKCFSEFDTIGIEFFCHQCKIDVKLQMENIGKLNENNNLGIYFKVWCKNRAHPRMKYEQHLIEIYPNKYFNYEPVFMGKLAHIYNDKWCHGQTVCFTNVDFVNDKNKRANSLNVDLCDVLFYEVLN